MNFIDTHDLAHRQCRVDVWGAFVSRSPGDSHSDSVKNFSISRKEEHPLMSPSVTNFIPDGGDSVSLPPGSAAGFVRWKTLPLGATGPSGREVPLRSAPGRLGPGSGHRVPAGGARAAAHPCSASSCDSLALGRPPRAHVCRWTPPCHLSPGCTGHSAL